MASAFSLAINNTNNFLRSPLDQNFDLDEVLTTITTNTSSTTDQDQQKIQDTETNFQLIVSNLPTVSATEGVCTVCMEDFQRPFPCKQVPCGHVFHSTCISSWISLSNSCPVCRSRCIFSGTTD